MTIDEILSMIPDGEWRLELKSHYVSVKDSEGNCIFHRDALLVRGEWVLDKRDIALASYLFQSRRMLKILIGESVNAAA